VVQVTTIYEWACKQPADLQTVEAGRRLLAQLPTGPFVTFDAPGRFLVRRASNTCRNNASQRDIFTV
jgi:hypothetical protein